MSHTLLVVNPNTTESVTVLLRRHVQREIGPAWQVRAVTARFGAPYIADEASYAVAGHAVLDAWESELASGHPAPDAVLVGCFGDPGLFALRESSPVPAHRAGGGVLHRGCDATARFAVVTGGSKWEAMLQRLALALGFGPALAGIATVALTGAQLSADPVEARTLLAQACRDATARWRPDALIVGGAALAGVAADLQADVDVPLIDSVAAGARWAVEALATGA